MKQVVSAIIVTVLCVTVSAQSKRYQPSEAEITKLSERIKRASDALIAAAKAHKESLERLIAVKKRQGESTTDEEDRMAEADRMIQNAESLDVRNLAKRELIANRKRAVKMSDEKLISRVRIFIEVKTYRR